MEYVYAELVRRGRDINTVPKSKIAATCVLLIISKDMTYAQVPTKYQAAVKKELLNQGYDENGEPIVTVTAAEE